MLIAALAVAGFVAGLTGAWSPCGFSMVSTLGAHEDGRRATLTACAAFVPGALAGGVLTFGLLSLLGATLGGGSIALIAGAVLAGAAALAELAGVRIAPQIRRQVPEHWRRVLPLPLAAAGYGVLLGVGFTTFVLTFAVPALAGIALAVGDPAAGVALGLAFGAGRALPVVALAPVAEGPAGVRAIELMAERPLILRGFRAADALALTICALALGTASADAATRAFLSPASDPSVAGADLAWMVPGGSGVIRSDGDDRTVEGRNVAIGGAYVARLVDDEIRVDARSGGARLAAFAVEGADKIAVADRWLVYRMRTPAGHAMVAQELPPPGPAFAPPAAPRTIATADAPAQLGRPALDGDRAVFHFASRRSSRIIEVDLATQIRTTLRFSRRTQITNPSLLGESLLFVQTTPYSQALMLGSRTGGVLRPLVRIAPSISADKGYSTSHGPHRRVTRPRRPRREGPAGTTTTLWTTALAPGAAYVTRVRERSGRRSSALLRFTR